MDYRILGPLEVRDGGDTADLGPPKQRSMLALLLLHASRAVPADRLADLLWAGEPPARAEASLRSYATNLRRVLPPGALVHAQGAYRLDVDDGDLDARRFERLVQEARAAVAAGEVKPAIDGLDEALALWRGPALADVAGGPFARAEAARLEEQRLAALELRFELALGAAAGDAGAAGGLVPELERAVRAHPLREGLRASLLRALHAAGRSSEALASYRDLQDRLADELGLDPSPALRELEAAIRTGSLAGPAATAGASGAGADRPRPPLVGRTAELARLRQALDAARSGHGRVVLLRGDPGIGKTRLVEELQREAAAGGVTTAWSTCFATGDAPAFWPWAQVVRDLGRQVDLAPLLDARTADVVDLVPDLDVAGRPDATARPPALAPDAARFQRYDAVTTLLTRAAALDPVLVVLDDVQWADPASLQLLAFLGRTLATVPVLVVATERLGEDEPDALRDALATLARTATVDRLDVGGLDDAAVVELVASSVAEAPGDDLVAAIVARAGGNPFFVTELLRLDPERLRADAVPAAIRDVIRQRLQRLGTEAARVLAVAAVIGRDVDLDVLTAIEGDAAIDALDEAVAAHLLEEDPASGRYRFPHTLVQEVLAEGLSGLRRARLHAAIARALDATSRAGDARLAELARHCCAGVPADPDLALRAAEVSLDAGAAAVRGLGYEWAAELYERALAAVDGTDLGPHPRARLLVALAEARRAGGDPAASRAACLDAAELARDAGDADLLAAAALGLALPGAVIGMDFGLLDELRIELLQAALDLLPPEDSATRVRVLAHLALALYLSDDRRRRQEAADEAVAMAERLGSPGLQAAALAAKRSTLWGPVSLEERTAAARALVALAEAGGASQTALEGHIALAIDLLEAGRIEDFDAEIRIVDERASALRQPFYAWYSRVLEATKASLEGRYADAATAAAQARDVGGVALGRRALWGQIGWQYVTAWDTGGFAEVEPHLRALASAFPGNAPVQTALAQLLAETGRGEEAAVVAGDLLADPALVPEDATWLFNLTLLAEAAAGIGDATASSRIADLLVPAQGRLVLAGSGVACCGAADRGRAVALVAAGRVDEAEAAFQAALDQNTRIGAVPWVARTQGGLAVLLLRRGGPGDEAEARRLLDAARATAERLGAAGLLAHLERIADLDRTGR